MAKRNFAECLTFHILTSRCMWDLPSLHPYQHLVFSLFNFYFTNKCVPCCGCSLPFPNGQCVSGVYLLSIYLLCLKCLFMPLARFYSWIIYCWASIFWLILTLQSEFMYRHWSTVCMYVSFTNDHQMIMCNHVLFSDLPELYSMQGGSLDTYPVTSDILLSSTEHVFSAYEMGRNIF